MKNIAIIFCLLLAGCTSSGKHRIKFLLDNESHIKDFCDIQIFVNDNLICSDTVFQNGVADDFKLCSVELPDQEISIKVKSIMNSLEVGQKIILNSDTTFLVTYRNPDPTVDTLVDAKKELLIWSIPQIAER